MISISVLFWLLVTHWVADFVFQTDWMARNKSSSNLPLFVHVCVYSLILIPFAVSYIPSYAVAWFIAFNMFLHFVVDYHTSRLTSKLSAAGKYGSKTVPNFGMFSIIGLDQMLHYISLVGTYYFFVNY